MTSGMDEDLIPAYHCDVCNGNVCKDMVAKKTDEFNCVCIDCYMEEI